MTDRKLVTTIDGSSRDYDLLDSGKFNHPPQKRMLSMKLQGSQASDNDLHIELALTTNYYHQHFK